MSDIRYLALGDSYTIGEGVAEAARWPLRLAALLSADGITTPPPRLVATTGWTTDELDAAMRQQRFGPPYDLVSLLIGVNNQYRGREPEQYRGEFRGLLDWAIALAGSRPARVLVLSIPDWGITPYAREHGRDAASVGAAIDRYNAVARAEVEAVRACWVDITGISRAHPDWLTSDGLHPSAEQYDAWARAALAPVRATLA